MGREERGKRNKKVDRHGPLESSTHKDRSSNHLRGQSRAEDMF